MTSDFLNGLNEPQLEAVTLPACSSLILAGAGSGKTRVLTTRISWLIHTSQVSPQGLLAVTFTNKAAKQLLLRIEAMLPINTRGMWVGTFHGLCNRMLRIHHTEAGLPALFQILDTQDQLSLIKRLMKQLNVSEERLPARQTQWYINHEKEAGRRPHQTEALDEMDRQRAKFYEAYEAQCQREGVVDFAELLLRSYELLMRNDRLRAHYQGRFKHILVDEFQDTNRLQYRWLQSLCGAQSVIFAVGDDDQSIYAFRGASTANMHDFQKDFGVEKLIKLEQNYRSHGHILDAANALIHHNDRRLGKNLWTAEGKGEPLRVYEASSDREEATFLMEEIKALRREGVPLGEMAILYRSNAQSRVIEHALFNAGLAYRVYGGLRFFERQEVKHALAYLRLVASVDDEGAFLRVVNFPARGIGARSLELLQALAIERGVSLWQAACLNELKGKAGVSVMAFVHLIERLKQSTAGVPLNQTIEQVIDESGLRTFYKNEKDGAERIENLDELVTAAMTFLEDAQRQSVDFNEPEVFALDQPFNDEGSPERFSQDDSPISQWNEVASSLQTESRTSAAFSALQSGLSASHQVLAAFLSHAALESGEHQAIPGAEALQMMSVHAAKGLEFHSVFITGLEEGLFPHENSLNAPEGLEEERRLMYVALTRARRRLYLSFAQCRMLHGQTRFNVSSRFFNEIPENLLKRINTSHTPYSDQGVSTQSVSMAYPSSASIAKSRGGGLGLGAGLWRIGQLVTHPRFGAGVIVSAEGQADEARVQVNFKQAGLKWLILAYAKLSAVN